MSIASIEKLACIALMLGACQTGTKLTGMDGNCKTRRLPVREKTIGILVSYPWCSACMEQISAFFSAYDRENLKPVYVVRNTMPDASPCLQGQLILHDAGTLFPTARPLIMYVDSISRLPRMTGVNIFVRNQWIRHDSLFSGMQLDSGRLANWLSAVRK